MGELPKELLSIFVKTSKVNRCFHYLYVCMSCFYFWCTVDVCRTFWSRIWGFSLALHTYWYTQSDESLFCWCKDKFDKYAQIKEKLICTRRFFLFEIQLNLRLVFWDWFWFFFIRNNFVKSFEIILLSSPIFHANLEF